MTARNMTDKTVLITGATGGLGQTVVETFLKANTQVVATFTSEKKYRQLAGEASRPSNLSGVLADLTNEDEVKKLFAAIKSKHRGLDALCHLTGGFWMGGDISETSTDDWNKMMTLNLRTAFLCTGEAFAIMKKQKQGHIITVSAKTALDLPGGMGAYAISKAAVLALTEVLAKEGKEYNIRVNTILPSVIDTNANRQSMPKADFAKWVTPEEIARMMLAMVRDDLAAVGTAIKMYGRV
jgi:NAD(P)-dependent dehydrogenase (short-subunit alcohol dehydrogenase family)